MLFSVFNMTTFSFFNFDIFDIFYCCCIIIPTEVSICCLCIGYK